MILQKIGMSNLLKSPITIYISDDPDDLIKYHYKFILKIVLIDEIKSSEEVEDILLSSRCEILWSDNVDNPTFSCYENNIYLSNQGFSNLGIIDEDTTYLFYFLEEFDLSKFTLRKNCNEHGGCLLENNPDIKLHWKSSTCFTIQNTSKESSYFFEYEDISSCFFYYNENK